MDAWDSEVGIATCFGPDSLWFEPQWKQVLLDPPRLALRPILPPVHWVLGLFLGGKANGTWH